MRMWLAYFPVRDQFCAHTFFSPLCQACVVVLVLLSEGPVLNYGLFTGFSDSGIFPLKPSLSGNTRVCSL